MNDVSPTLQPIRSRFIPRKRLLNGTIGRSSDLSYFASFPIGLPPISGLFAKDTLNSKLYTLNECADLQQRVCYGFSPYSLFNQGVTPDTYYLYQSAISKSGAKVLLFFDICNTAPYFIRIFVYGLQQQTPAYPSERYAGVCVYVFIPYGTRSLVRAVVLLKRVVSTMAKPLGTVRVRTGVGLFVAGWFSSWCGLRPHLH